MTTSNINVRLDEDLKHDFSTLCDDLGLPMSAAVTVFIKTMVRQRGLPFPLTEQTPQATLEALREAEALLADPDTMYYADADELFRAKGWK